MNPAERAATDCFHFMNARCANGNRCPWRHDEMAARSWEVCGRWAQYMHCDGRCRRQHPTDPNRPSKPLPPVAAQETRPCVFYAKGACAKGAHCPFWHDPALEVQPQSLRAAAAAEPPESAAPSGVVDSDAEAKAAAIMQKHSVSQAAAARGQPMQIRGAPQHTEAEVGGDMMETDEREEVVGEDDMLDYNDDDQ